MNVDLNFDIRSGAIVNTLSDLCMSRLFPNLLSLWLLRTFEYFILLIWGHHTVFGLADSFYINRLFIYLTFRI